MFLDEGLQYCKDMSSSQIIYKYVYLFSIPSVGFFFWETDKLILVHVLKKGLKIIKKILEKNNERFSSVRYQNGILN